ncbi:MAG: deoxyguanosinetriphosphate triphosphohydrolase [Pseudomonadota bacterium]
MSLRCTLRWRLPMHKSLVPYAAQSEQSQGRRYDEAPSRYRDAFARDRDRVVHSNAFRRLVYKTQVFVNHEGDLYRTRLTHSLEVAQAARTVANALGLNESLTEAICLAHDLGHTPFGHAGQDALNACMRDHDGFEHNLQSLRIVDVLERKYPAFDGLNLTFETREGILKHCSARDARQLGDVGRRFLERQQPSLEAQLANVADEIAYNHHDIDDGLRAGLLDIDELAEIALFGEPLSAVTAEYPRLDQRRVIHETIRRMFGAAVQDLIDTTGARLAAVEPTTVDAVRAQDKPIVGFSAAVRASHLAVKRFLRDKLYRHQRVKQMTDRAHVIINELFAAYMNDPSQLPDDYACRIDAPDPLARVVADYVAGMTDRFAQSEYERLRH